MESYDIAMLVPGMPFNGDSLDSVSLGGSETAGLCMARELGELGHNINMFCNTDAPGKYGPVTYYPIDMWQAHASTVPHDISIVQRAPNAFGTQHASRLNILWNHDLASARDADAVRGLSWNIDSIFVLSEFMRRQYIDAYRLDKEILWKTRNGIDLHRFPKPVMAHRDRMRLVYAARPERGLDVMLEHIFPALLQRESGLHLHIYGYDNPVSHLADFYASLRKLSLQFGDRVQWAGQLPKAQLYERYAAAGVYTYPTPSQGLVDFNEISCISMMEAMACGLPVVTSARGALPETLAANAGTLIRDSDPWSPEYVKNFCDATLRYVHDDDAFAKASRAGQRRAKALSWKGVAESWTDKFAEMFAERNDDPVRLAHHFYRRTDIIAAKAALKGNKSPAGKALVTTLAAEYDWLGGADYAEHYRKGGESTDARLSGQESTQSDFDDNNEPRFAVIAREIAARPDAIKILDFGCGHGWHAIKQSNAFPDRQFVGIDIDPGAIKWAKTFAGKHGKHPKNMKFAQGDHNTDLSHFGKFDMVIVSEVLEHCVDPTAVIAAIEKFVKPGGYVLVTVPFGPSEYGTYNWVHFRNHLWEFDLHDLRDIFGKKEHLGVDVSPTTLNVTVNETVGFYTLWHIASPDDPKRKFGRVNMKRKLRLQRPRQTLSVSMMGGPGCEETLLWAMKPVQFIADEIVLADCGLSPEAKAIAARFNAKIVSAPSPLDAGFEVPRNIGLQACTMDYVFWIDTDEKMIDPQNVCKYLRQNRWHSYSVRQHHLSIDTGWPPDLPARIFRRATTADGKTMAFFGVIHEHPEFGLNEGPGSVLVPADLHLVHVGYLNENTRINRFWRNRPLMLRDIEKYPDRKLQKHFIIRDNVLLCEYELRANGSIVTDQIRAWCKEAMELYRDHFLGSPTMQNTDSLPYYSRALEIVGEGINFSFDLRARRDDKGDQLNGTVVRFANADEAAQEMAARTRVKMAPLESAHW